MPHGHLDATDEVDQLKDWLVNPPLSPDPDEEVRVAFVPGSGGCGVLDFDIKHGGQGPAVMAKLTSAHGLVVTAAWRTPSGGVNVLFTKPPGVELSNYSPWDREGVNLRADNGWVVAPDGDGWRWVRGGFHDASPLPDAMLPLLRPAAAHEHPATSAETVAFIEASTRESSLPAMQAFAEQLAAFRQATVGSRHPALVQILSWAFGMNALDLRKAVKQITAEWLTLTAGEGRQDEVLDFATWVVAQEQAKRAEPIDVYQPGTTSIFIDWREFAKRDTTAHLWLVENLWPVGRAIALWAGAKEGKSELVLWCAAKLAMGEHPWTGAAIDPVDIAYFDFEMTEDDLDERLSDFGFDLTRLDRLHYALLPPLHSLDAEVGGEELAQLVRDVGARGVVIDTFARSVKGAENDADTVQDFYRFTGIRLKQMGVGYLRLDHAGHDKHKAHPRGSSAKRDDIDVIWRQTRTSTGVQLDCANASRLGWVGPKLDIDRVVDPQTGIVSYSAPVRFGWPAGTVEKAAELDQIKLPPDAGRPAAITALRAAGKQPGRWAVLSAALKYRREASKTVPKTAGTAFGHTFSGTGEAQGSDEPPDLFSEQP
jgi:hypothetical protein